MITRSARLICNATTAFFGNPLTVVASMAASAGSLAWAIFSPTELSWTLFLSILAIAMQAADLFKSRQ